MVVYWTMAMDYGSTTSRITDHGSVTDTARSTKLIGGNESQGPHKVKSGWQLGYTGVTGGTDQTSGECSLC
jgi:hypothetical protein